YTQFFAQTNPGLDNSNFDNAEIASKYQAEGNAREALAQKLGSSFEQTDSFSSTDYMNKLNHSLSEIAWTANDYNALFTAMQKKGVDISQYENDLALISRYGNVAVPRLYPAQAKFGDAPSDNNTKQTFVQQLTIKVPAGKNYQLKPTALPDVPVTYIADQSSVQSTEEAKIVDNGNGKLILYNQDHTVDNNGTPTTVTNTSEASFTICYDITLGQITQPNQPAVQFSWGINGNENNSSGTYKLYPANEISEYLGGDKFGDISDLLNQIDETAHQIT
ncbi:hypothetical protein EFE32_07225, partial [Lactococcus lactis subsp. lactis]|uniref:hypothetical protein n=1 Tax=Lactococcus lactis TaxID=1358 RepID=UPI00223C4BF5